MSRRIVQVSPNYPPLLGGLERVVQLLAMTLAEHNDVRVLTTTAGAPGVPRRQREGRVEVRRHRAVTVAHTALAPGMLVSLLRIPRDCVIHLHCAQAVIPELVWLSARLRRTRYLVHFHMDVGTSGPLGWLLPLYKKQLFGRVMRGAAGVIVLTESQARFVEETYRIGADRVFVVPNGVAGEYYLPPRAPEPGPLRLLFVGRLGVQKNVALLLDALAEVTEPVRLRIVGEGELRAGLEAKTERLGLADRVEFCGRLHGPDLVKAYADAQAFVLPSEREGMPLVLLEAMAAGLPVIATAVQGNIELVDGAGLLAEPNPRELAAAIDLLARDAERRAELAAAGAQRAAGFTWEAVVAAVEQVYDKLGFAS